MKLNFTSSIFSCLLLFLFANTANARLRVIANTYCYSNGTMYVPSDSSTYTYSGHRGSTISFNTFYWTVMANCDTNYYYYPTASGSYYTNYRIVNTFDVNDNMLTSTYQQCDTAHKIWYNQALYSYAYDANNNQVSSLTQYWDTTGGSGGVWKNSGKTTVTYDANNNNITDTTFSWLSGAWTNSQLMVHTYDSHNYLLETQSYYYYTSAWINSQKTIYNLNAGHKPDSTVQYVWDGSKSSWDFYMKDAYVYDASYNILADTSSFWNSTSNVWLGSNLNLYTYSGSDVASDEMLSNTTMTGWTKYQKKNMTYDASHDLLTTVTQYWKSYKSAYDNVSKGVNIYNTENLISSYTTTTWDSASSSWIQSNGSDQQDRFYYESYVGAGVSNVNMQASAVQLYPNPAGNYMNIAISNTDNKALTLAVYDMNGKQYKQWQTPAGNNYNATVPVNELPAGNYIIEVTNGTTQTTKQFSVVH